MTEATMTAENNGTVSMTARETIAAQLETEIQRCRERRDVLEAELARVTGGIKNDIAQLGGEIKSFEQALARLRGEPLIKHPGSGPRGPYNKSQRVREKPAGISDEKIDRIKQAIFTYSADHDEFRQVDIRAVSGDDSSGRMAMAFEQLRQQGLIRFSRKDGLAKCFRLTTDGIRERDEAVDAS